MVTNKRERISTPDDDFIDLDWSKKGFDKLVLVLHGLEGDASRPYVQGMIRLFNQNGYDGVGMNFRGCSGEMNKALRMYHNGEIEDVGLVLRHIEEKYQYGEIVLIGFSLGGNVTLNYVARSGQEVHPLLKKAVAFSVPTDLVASAKVLDGEWFNSKVYVKRFLKQLYEKARLKEQQYPGTFDLPKIKKFTTFHDFDHHVTAKVSGFESAIDYYTKASSLPHLKNIAIPTLIVNAKNDSFLSESSYPFDAAHNHPFVYLEVPKHGGHVGFAQYDKNGVYYSEKRALDFVLERGDFANLI
ncbi:MAG: alpha/beta fold hydrolase [Bacteroidota bacterium]